MSAAWPDLPDGWVPTTTNVAPKDESKKKEERVHVPRKSEGHEQDAKEPKGDGQWASMGELLM